MRYTIIQGKQESGKSFLIDDITEQAKQDKRSSIKLHVTDLKHFKHFDKYNIIVVEEVADVKETINFLIEKNVECALIETQNEIYKKDEIHFDFYNLNY